MERERSQTVEERRRDRSTEVQVDWSAFSKSQIVEESSKRHGDGTHHQMLNGNSKRTTRMPWSTLCALYQRAPLSVI